MIIVLVPLIPLALVLIQSDTDLIALPPPDLQGHLPLSYAMTSPGFSRMLKDHQATLSDIGQLLWALQGITHGSRFRTVPSAGGTYPLEVFIAHGGSSSLDKGCYHYKPQNHEIERISLNYSQNDLLSAFYEEDYEVVSNVTTVFFVHAEYSRTTDRYGGRGVQYVHLEAGHAIGNFLLQLTSMNLKTKVITNFTSEKIQELFNTTFTPLVTLPLGSSTDIFSISPVHHGIHPSDEVELTVEQAISRRKSVRDYTNGTIPYAVVSNILVESTSIMFLIGNNSQLDVRLVAGEVNGLDSGLYYFDLGNKSLNLTSLGDLQSELQTAGLNQSWIGAAQLDIVISADIDWINSHTDSVYSHRVLMFNVGMVAQNVYLKCASYGLGTVSIGAFYEYDVANTVNSPDGFVPFYIMPVGLTMESNV